MYRQLGAKPNGRPMRSSRLLSILAVAVVAGVFLTCALPGLFVGFDGDDLMNLHEAVMKTPLARLAIAFVVPFTTVNRPTGEAYYGICFGFFGWHPFGFRLTTYLLLAANIGLVYALTRELSEPAEAGFLAALLFSFHGRLWQIYLSNATVYDVLCTFFFLLSLWYYIALRRRLGSFTWRQSVEVTVLFILAVNAKEMAAVIPAVLLTFDWTYMTPIAGSIRERVRWILRNSRLAVVLAVVSVGAVLGKAGSTSTGLLVNPAYAPTFTLQRFFQNAKLIYSELFYLKFMELNGRRVVLLWIVFFVIAFLSRRKSLRFLTWFAMLAPLPIMFIPWRGFFVMYLPMTAWAMYAGILLVWIRDLLMEYFSRTTAAWMTAGRLTLAAVVAAIVLSGLRDPIFRAARFDSKGYLIEQSKQDFLALNEPLPAGAGILLMHSRFPPDVNGYYPYMMAQLLYGDRHLELFRPEMMHPPPDDAAIATFDRVLDFTEGRLVVRRRLHAPGADDVLLPATSPRLFGFIGSRGVK